MNINNSQFRNNRLNKIVLVILFHISFSANCQYLNLPESIVYDKSYSRYLVSNYGTGSLISIDENGNQSTFVSNMNATQGLCIIDTIVYVGCDSTVRGFNLNTGEQIMNLFIPNVVNLNDVTSDSDKNLYVTDVFGTKIIKVNPTLQSYSVFVNGQGIINPNGITYDSLNNRLLVCSYRENFPVQAIQLSDSSVSTLLYTNLDYSDGICIDKQGNVYFTSWTTKSIYKVNADFSSTPVIIYSNPGGPADISYDKTNDKIAIPLQLSNSVDFLDITTTSIYNMEKQLSICKVFPNPSNGKLEVYSNIGDKISIFNMSANLIQSRISSEKIESFEINHSGSYIIQIRSNNYIYNNTIVIN